VLCALGNLYLQTGRAADARDILLKAKDEAEALGHAASTVLASVYLASAYAHLGDIPAGWSSRGPAGWSEAEGLSEP